MIRLISIYNVVILMYLALHVESHYDAADVMQVFEKWTQNLQGEDDIKGFDDLLKELSEYNPKLSDGIHINNKKNKCSACKSSMQAAINSYRNGILTQNQLNEVGLRLCYMISGYDEDVCRGLVNLNLPIFLYIIDHEPRVNASSFCGLMYQSRNPSVCPLEDDRFEFSVSIPEKPARLKASEEGENVVGEHKGKPLKIIHLSDAHIDTQYEPEGAANCNAPCCCRKGQKTTATTTKAGYWGDYGMCDTPLWALQDVLDHVTENHKDIDFVYYTGDTVDHAIWETTYESCEEEIRFVNDRFKEAFGNTPVFPVIGNHEAQPMNMFASESITDPNLSTKWLYDLLIEGWSSWLPESTSSTIRRGGFYTALVKPGFRIVALNNNVAYNYNWWIALNPNDPGGQLKWLVDTLYKAEQAGEIVHILAHIPPGSDTYATWSREYKRIIDRFSNIIAAEFNGHSHTDAFKIYYDSNNLSKATNVAWNGGSMVTYVSYNLNYKVMFVDSQTYIPIDIDTYIYNLTDANLTPKEKPKWFKEYSFKEAYGLESLSVGDIDSLVKGMVTDNKNLLEKYIDLHGKLGDAYLKTVSDQRQKYGSEFEFDYVCDIVTTDLEDGRKCEEFKKIFSAHQ